MASNLLKKEEEYRKLNEELQNRNKKLMEEYNLVMKKQDNLLKESQNEPKFDHRTFSEEYKPKCGLTRLDSATKENYDKYPDDDTSFIPDSVDQMGVKGMTCFYRAKIKAMQNESNQLQLEYKNKCEETKKIQKDNLRLVEEKDKWFQAYNTNKINMNKLENQLTTVNSKCQSKENENASLKKEIEQLKKDLKSAALNVSGHEIRLNRALEESEKMKSALKIAKQEEKDLKEAHRKEVAEITVSAKRLEKQKTELLTAFKKQLQLIDNLKKQKVFLEASKLTQISETEFMRILDWKLD